MKNMKITYLIPFLLITFQANSMKRMNAKSPQSSPSKRLKRSVNIDNLIYKIIQEIHLPENSAAIVAELLSQPEARDINISQRKELYELAKDFAVIFPETSSTVIKKNYLHAFLFFSNHLFPQAFFSPNPYKRLSDTRPDLQEIITTLIQSEQEKIYICCYHLSLKSIANSIIQQKNNGVAIEVIVNQFEKERPNTWLVPSELQNIGITTLSPQNDPYEQMHHKFFIFKKNIFGKSILVTGSYNPTAHSNKHSWDDIIILDDQNIINTYIERFEDIKKRSK